MPDPHDFNVIITRDIIVTNLINALPGNSSVNMVQHATIDEAVFSVLSASLPVLVTDQSTHGLTCDTCFLCGLRHARVEGLCFLCVVGAESMWEIARMGIDWTWILKFQENSSVARRRMRRLSVWSYMCCSTLILGVCNLVRLLQFLCWDPLPGKG
jgi:hypothetical protein